MRKIRTILESFKHNYDSQKVNTGRQGAVDLARGLAVFFMVLVHVLETYGDVSAQNSIIYEVIEFLGGPPAAPVFMLLMGVSIAYSRNASPVRIIKRGWMIFFLGYVLSLLRDVIPIYIGLRTGIYTRADLIPYTFKTLALQVDILQLAGLALVFIGILGAMRIKKIYYLLIAGLLSLAAPYLWGLKFSALGPLNYLFDPLWGERFYVYFPFFTWAFYPLLGVYVGDLLVRSRKKSIFYKFSFIAGWILILMGLVITSTNYSIHMEDYWRHGIGGNLTYTGFTMSWWALLYFVMEKLLIPGFLSSRLYFWSKNVTVFYFFHWVLIGWGALLIGYESASIPWVILLMAVVVLISDRLTALWIYLRGG